MTDPGQPTERWVVEAVWIANEEGEPATFETVARHIVEVQGVDHDEAHQRILDAVRDGEVHAHLDEATWLLGIDTHVAQVVAQRHRFWTRVRSLVPDEAWQTDRIDPAVLDQAWQRLKEDGDVVAHRADHDDEDDLH